MSSLKQNGKPTLGVLAGWQFYRTATNLSYLKPVFHGISQAAQNLGCNVLFGCGMGASARTSDPIRPTWPTPAPDVDYVPIGPFNTDGLIVCNPLHSPARSQYIQDLVRTGFPILFIGSGEQGPTLVADNTGGILEAIQHLVDHGHRQIVFLAGSPEDMSGDTGERLKAYQEALKRHRLESHPDRIVFGRHVFDGGYTAMRQIIASGIGFSAVLSSNDEMALGAMKALHEAGNRVPQDVAVIGFDNRLEGAAHDPALSSIHVPLFSMGQRAVELLLQHVEGKRELPIRVKIPTRLILRESCGCRKGQSPRLRGETAPPDLNMAGEAQRAYLVPAIATNVLSQAQSMGEAECLLLSESLVDEFYASVKHNHLERFSRAFTGILEKTTAHADDVSIWQEALSSIGEACARLPASDRERALMQQILDAARQTITARLKRQYQNFVANQQWISSRLSLLTASLMTALDEEQIYKTLAQHLPEMGIHFGHIVLFEAGENAPFCRSSARDIFHLDKPPARFLTQDFPPEGLFEQNESFTLSLIPLFHPSGQMGFAVFGTDHFDLYGAIVQQIAGALNTAVLYRQAEEGRKLAEEANRMKSRFLSTISHELRTPLNLIVGLSGMLLRENEESDTPLPEATQADIERIQAYSQHLGGLIGDVIDLAASDTGQLRLNYEPVNLGQALRLVVESGSQLAADKGLTWSAKIPESGPWVWGDQTRLRQVALNLINNAIKFTSHGEVSMRLEQTPGYVTLTIQDSGLGIPLEDQATIFDEFSQSERSIAKGYGGLGLGLAICKRLVEAHHGTITVSSSGEEGLGSTFSFTLPTLQLPLEKPEGTDTPLLAEEPTILVLTNSPSSVERLVDHLKQREYKIQVTRIGQELDWSSFWDNPPPDTIIVDISTDPGLGWKTLKDIKESQILAGIPAMFYSSSQLQSSLFDLDYLTKPIEISELTKALDQHWLMADDSRPIRNILVVDDEPATLDMHARIVQSHSASNRVLRARNGREALDILHHEIVDLMLLDLQMPEMDGFELLEELQKMEATRDIPVIVVTGKVLSETEMSRLNQGVTSVLGKGLFSIKETIAHISAALERKRRISNEAKRLVRQAMGYIHKNFSESMSRRDIAQQIGITEDHLTFCFRQELGVTPIQYLQRYRINQAKRLLKESELTITEIAFNVGFSDSGYFSRLFHRETGLSPETYRHTSTKPHSS